MKHFLGNDWEIYPAGGLTGEAFYACHNDEKLFLKRNSSPFLAVLSAEGIVPKLVWTKRLENGDVITAQQWIKGKILEPYEMNDERVAHLLKKIHHSKPLLSMLHRLGKFPIESETLVQQLEARFETRLIHLSNIQKAFRYLKANLSETKHNQWAVCHGDVHHNNWIMTETGSLYLIDWDHAFIGDPAIDIGPLLYWYIPENDWKNWLSTYGLTLDDSLRTRMKWYVFYQTLNSIQLFYEKEKKEEYLFWIDYLDTLF
ncbi:phosphotransferase family protein [Fervidibacillus halotolerans]|uniref:Phosphotransferase family protein n=1 Tax=Fervidibacillus halotolerans TaxID=2980027 RepID=A0A9E8LXV6_9BACI|nr:phosphotransferase family protein [Fervidibacillus halotolerans]WAA11758.1 phosphotransferase family protein [Fervidibacillus halotolerans]